MDYKSLRIAKKNLQKVFKNWFRSGNTPQTLIPEYTEKLNYPEELKEKALYIVQGVHRELESCQPKTVVGVALFMLNQWMPRQYVEEFHKNETEIANLIDKTCNNIKEKHDRIRHLEKEIIPPEW